jgi:ferric-dicitrate binding protein FerR (iron transport regulator)
MTVQTPRRAPSPDRDAQRPLKPAGPAAPPAAPRRRKDPLWAQLTLIFGAALMVVSGIGIVGSKALIGSAIGAVTQQNLLGGTKKTLAEGGRPQALGGRRPALGHHHRAAHPGQP